MAVQFEWRFSLKKTQNCNLWQRLSDRSVTSIRHSGTRRMIGFSCQAQSRKFWLLRSFRHYGRWPRRAERVCVSLEGVIGAILILPMSADCVGQTTNVDAGRCLI